jgi:hypothetical protein
MGLTYALPIVGVVAVSLAPTPLKKRVVVARFAPL